MGALGSGGRRALQSRSHDVTILQRELVSTLPTFEFASGRPRVLDVDDAIHLKQRLGAADRIASACDLIWCGNAELADHFADFAQTAIIPTSVDTQRYAPGHDSRDDLTIGWMGTGGNLPELDDIAPALERVLDERRHVRMRVVSDRPGQWRLAGHPSVDAVEWSAEREVAELQGFDIGLMPLRDTPWARGKCGFKLLTYLACGVAAVGSPVGVNGRILGDDPASTPSTPEQWRVALLQLIDHDDLRTERGAAGRRRVESEYSVDAVAPLIERSLRRLAPRA